MEQTLPRLHSRRRQRMRLLLREDKPSRRTLSFRPLPSPRVRQDLRKRRCRSGPPWFGWAQSECIFLVRLSGLRSRCAPYGNPTNSSTRPDRAPDRLLRPACHRNNAQGQKERGFDRLAPAEELAQAKRRQSMRNCSNKWRSGNASIPGATGPLPMSSSGDIKTATAKVAFCVRSTQLRTRNTGQRCSGMPA
jgi:hypothetical protein